MLSTLDVENDHRITSIDDKNEVIVKSLPIQQAETLERY